MPNQHTGAQQVVRFRIRVLRREGRSIPPGSAPATGLVTRSGPAGLSYKVRECVRDAFSAVRVFWQSQNPRPLVYKRQRSHRATMRERAVDLARRGRRGATRGIKRARRGFVFTITREDVIHGVVMAGVFAIIQLTIDQVARLVNAVVQTALGGWSPLHTQTKLVLLAGVVYVAFWANDNRGEWRDWVAETTGEEKAVEEAEEADGDNNKDDGG